MKNILRIIVAVVVFNAAAISAEDNAGKNAHDDHAEHNHHASLFLGATSHFDHGHSVHAFTAGLDYEYRFSFLNRLLGIGILDDMAFFPGALTNVSAVFIGIHPIGGLKILLAPGVEMIFLEKLKTAFLLRGSLGYDFMIGNFSLTPIVSIDYLPAYPGSFALVYGVAAGIGF